MHLSNSEKYRNFDALGLSNAFYTTQIKNFLEGSEKLFVQNLKRVQDLSAKSCGFHVVSKYKSYCVPSYFLELIHSASNAIIITNSSPSTVQMGHWLCIFQIAKNREILMLLAKHMHSTQLKSKTS